MIVLFVFCLLFAMALSAHASALYPDEPTGWSQLVRHQFNDKTNGGACNDYYPGSGSFIAQDSSWTISQPNFIRNIKYANASHGGTVIECLFSARRSMFWGFSWRTSNPFGGYNNGANKLGFMMSNRPTGGGALWGLHFYGSSNGSRVVSVFLQASAGVNNCHLSDYQGDCNGSSVVFLPNVNGSAVLEGVKHRVEVTMIRSTTESSRDGTIRVVVDGIVRTNYTNANFPAWDFISVQNNHTWDGQCATRTPSDCRPYDDYHDFDDWYVSSGTGGAGGGSSPPPPPPLPPNRPTNLRVQ